MKLINWIKYIFIVIGVGLLLGGVYSYLSTNSFISVASKAEGLVIDLVFQSGSSGESNSSSSTYKPAVRFRTAGGENIEFISTVGSNPPSHRKGERVTVLYLPDNPQRAKIDSFLHLWFLPALFGGMGSIFFSVGAGMVFQRNYRRRKAEHVRQVGQRIITNFQRVESPRFSKRARSHAFYIVSQWINPATSELHVFRSEPLVFDPSDHIKGDQIAVYIERNNPKNYVVDLDFLPRFAE